MGYHLVDIHKHAHTSPWKLVEESMEFIDSLATSNKIMAGVELSDLYGALEIQAAGLGLSMQDLAIMSNATKRSFTTDRPSFDLLSFLKTKADTIKEFGLGFIQVKVDNVNYNVYSSEVDTFPDYDKPHNHQQDFISEILQGELVETLYHLTEGDVDLKCVCGDPSVILPNKSYKLLGHRVHKEGDLYLRKQNEWHSVSAIDGTVTKVTKIGDKIDAFAFGEIAEYSSTKTEDELWNIIEQILL